MTGTQNYKRNITLISFSSMFLLRVMFLVFVGPQYSFDSRGYIDFANLILSDQSWLHDAMLHTFRPITVFKPIGYPAIIAASKLLFGNNFDYALVLFQSMMSIFTSYFLFRIGLLLSLRWCLALLGATFYSLSYVLFYDLSILTDSIFSNLFVLIIGVIAIGVLKGSPPGKAQMLMLGICFSVAILIRVAGLYLVPIIALGIVLWTRRVGYRLLSQVIVVTLFILPSIAVWQGYKAWNEYRTGTPFMTTQHSMLIVPVVAIELKGRHVIQDNSLIAEAYLATAPEGASKPDTVVKPVPTANTLGELISWIKGRRYNKEALKRVTAINMYLFTEHGGSEPDFGRLASDAFYSALFSAPGEFALYALAEFWPTQLFPFFNITEAPRTIINNGTSMNIPSFGDRIRRLSTKRFDIEDILWILIESGERLISVLIFVAFAVGLPVSALQMWRRDKEINRRVLVLLWFLLLYTALTGMYSLVHFEMRYTMGVQALAILGGLTVLQGWIDRRFLGSDERRGSATIASFKTVKSTCRKSTQRNPTEPQA